MASETSLSSTNSSAIPAEGSANLGATTLHKAANSALKLAEQGAGVAFPFVIAALKGIEYAVLGLLLAWLGKRTTAGAMTYRGRG